jgi:hypothetical protein
MCAAKAPGVALWGNLVITAADGQAPTIVTDEATGRIARIDWSTVARTMGGG